MTAPENRRRTPRLHTGSIVHARCVDPLLRILSLHDLSLGGFAIETDSEVLPGLEKTFEFDSVTGLTTIARAVAVHCRLSATGGRSYVSGWRFADISETADGVQALVDVLVAELPPT
jgi:hypothetical protein